MFFLVIKYSSLTCYFGIRYIIITIILFDLVFIFLVCCYANVVLRDNSQLLVMASTPVELNAICNEMNIVCKNTSVL